jgi:signal transduction histidine kinase
MIPPVSTVLNLPDLTTMNPVTPAVLRPSFPAKVLVVDDEPYNREIITNFLQMEGFDVATAEDGEQALELAVEEAPDVILLDVMMPGPNGFEVCRQLKGNPATVFIPIVILTALRGNTEERIKGAAAGADEFLSKPFDHMELVTRVKSLLRVKRLYDKLHLSNQELEMRVTERTLDLQRALAELRELDQLKSEFIANVSHELRTPLLHVKGYVDLLANGVLGAVNNEQAHGLKIAQGAIEQLERMVKDIVDFSDVYDQQLALEPVSLHDVFEAVLSSLEMPAKRKSIQLVTSIAPEVPLVLADVDALTRVLRHLLDNAVKFGPTGDEVSLTAAPQAGLIRVAVSDHGPGIAPDKQEKIFKLFYQEDGSTTRKVGGLGLGLSLARKLLESHSVKLLVESTVGVGSTFYFDLSPA